MNNGIELIEEYLIQCDCCLGVVDCYVQIERVKMQKNRGRKPETFMLFDSREVRHNDGDHLWNPISIGIEQEAAIHRQIPHREHQHPPSHCHSQWWSNLVRLIQVQKFVYCICVWNAILGAFEHHKYDVLSKAFQNEMFCCSSWIANAFVVYMRRHPSLIMEYVHFQIPMRMLFALRNIMYRIWCRGGFGGILLCLSYNRFWCNRRLLSRPHTAITNLFPLSSIYCVGNECLSCWFWVLYGILMYKILNECSRMCPDITLRKASILKHFTRNRIQLEEDV